MAERQDIAIIGLSGVLPGAGDMRQFYLNLCGGVDSVGPMPAPRRAAAGFDPEKTYINCGYLDRIDEFDHQFFNISKREAEQMDPQQRFALELTCAAIENAGYSLSGFRGTRTAVSLAALQNSYSALLDTYQDGPALIGNLTASVAGKISYYLDLHGPAVMIDTSCSSSLVAVHDACSKILLGEADYAVAGGINLYVFFPEQTEFSDPLGIAAPDGKSKTFDARADGTGIGEGAGIVLLKPLARALADRDHIHAVIKASAINQDGGRSNGVASPSPLAQTEVIVETWRRAGVNPDTLTCVEAHGTGTHLGDPIEVQALTDAFRQYTGRKQFCAVSSVKTNIGHLGFAAGVSGLLKVVLGLKHRQLFPSLHFERANPCIDFDSSPLFVNTRLHPWDGGETARRAAVSSFGISGTNAHVLLEEAPPRPSAADAAARGDYLVTLSAKTPAALSAYAARLAGFVAETEETLADISFVLNAGRDDYAYRFACVVADKARLGEMLKDVAEGRVSSAGTKEQTRVVMLCSGDAKASAEVAVNLRRGFPAFDRAWSECLSLHGAGELRPPTRTFFFQYSLARLWRSFGITPQHVLGTGVGNLVVAVETGRITLAEAVRRAAAFDESAATFKAEQFRKVLGEIVADAPPVFLELGPGGLLSQGVLQFEDGRLGGRLLDAYATGERADLLSVLARLYTANVNPDWTTLYEGTEARRVELPTYPFERTSCWVRKSPTVAAGALRPTPAPVLEPAVAAAEQSFGGLATETERVLAGIWIEVLKPESVGREDDYFEIGGNSLSATQVLSRIEEEFGVSPEFEALYDYPTLSGLAAHVDELRAASAVEGDAPPAETKAASIARVERSELMALSFAQERLFHLYRLEPESPYYNMPGAIRLRGELNVGALEASLREIVRRHEVVRTTYLVRDGEPAQVIVPDAGLVLPVEDLGRIAADVREEEALKMVAAEAARPFDLGRELPLRVRLLRLADDDHVLLLTMHHIASDSWSVGIIFRELTQLYAAHAGGESPSLPELPVQYVDYAYWQREWLTGENWEQHLGYWRRQLADAPTLLTLPADRPRPAVQSFRGDALRIELPAALTTAARALGREEDATLFMTLLAVYETLLSRYSGQEVVCVGSPIANRTRPELEKLIGFFANTIVLRGDLSGNPTFREFLRRVRETTRGAFAHQSMPFEKLVQIVAPRRSTAYTPLFQAAFALQNAPLDDLKLGGLALQYLVTESATAKFDLTLSLTEEGDRLVGLLEYSTDLFDRETAERLSGSFRTLLEGVVADPDRPLRAVPLVSEAERDELLFGTTAGPVGASLYDFNM